MTIASRTPEGEPNRCPVCGAHVLIEPSRPANDAPCPACGHLLWFPPAQLVALTGSLHGTAFLIGHGKTLLGRCPGAARCRRIIVPEVVPGWKTVSLAHVLLHAGDGRLAVEDLGSGHGTFVNGRRLPPGHPKVLRTNDELRIGRVAFRVVVPEPAG